MPSLDDAYTAIETARQLLDNYGQPVCQPFPEGGWVIECAPNEAQALQGELMKRPEGSDSIRIVLAPDWYMPAGMLRALPYDVWNRRMKAENAKFIASMKGEHPCY